MTATMPDQHEHEWGPGGACGACGAKRCVRWHCQAARVVGARCRDHAGGAAHRPDRVPDPSPRARTVRVTVYSLPGACRAELR
jgi:hypothetical protein